MSYYQDEIKRLKKEEDREKKLEDVRDGAQFLRDTITTYVAVGFTEEQAYEMLLIQLKK
jgi:hypothetical protein